MLELDHLKHKQENLQNQTNELLLEQQLAAVASTVATTTILNKGEKEKFFFPNTEANDVNVDESSEPITTTNSGIKENNKQSAITNNIKTKVNLIMNTLN